MTFFVLVIFKLVAILAIQYFRSNGNTGGKVVITSSAAGLYASAAQPQYGAAKYGCIGLTRSLGASDVLKKENITINAICPSFVPTGLAPPQLLKGIFPLEYLCDFG